MSTNRIVLLMIGVCLLASPRAAQAGQSASQKLSRTDWSNIHGVNFVPVYAKNTYEIWHNYDHTEVDRELGLAASVGLNTVRLWLNVAAYEEMGPKMLDNVADALRLTRKHHMRAVMVLFDSCGVRPRQNARMMSALDAYEEFQSSSRFTVPQKELMRHLFYNFVHGIGKDVQVPVAADTPMSILIWVKWQPTPGNDRLDPESYPQLEKYVSAVIGRFKNDRTVILWDLMNEPEFASEGPLSPTEIITPTMLKTLTAFLEHFYGYVKQHYPNQLVCEGWANVKSLKPFSKFADVLTFHVYKGPEELQAQIDEAQDLARKEQKTVFITETLANWTFGSADFGKESPELQQLTHYKQVLPILMNSRIGWMSFGLVAEKSGGPLAIFSYDGEPRPVAQYLKQTLKDDLSGKEGTPSRHFLVHR
jgi:hypothetical protein